MQYLKEPEWVGRKVHSTMAESALGPRADTATLQVHAQLLELREAAEGAGHVLAAVVALGGGGKVKSSTQGSGSRPGCGGGILNTGTKPVGRPPRLGTSELELGPREPRPPW